MVGQVRPRWWASAPAEGLLGVLGQIRARVLRGVLDAHFLLRLVGEGGVGPAELQQGQVALGEVILVEELHVRLGRLDPRLLVRGGRRGRGRG